MNTCTQFNDIMAKIEIQIKIREDLARRAMCCAYGLNVKPRETRSK